MNRLVLKNLMIRSSSAEFLIFERQKHDKDIQVRFENGDLWLTQRAIGELFNIDRTVVTKHIKNIYSEFEMDKNSTSANANDVKTRYTKIGMYRHLRGDGHFNIGNGYAWVMIDWASLSQENKQLFMQLNSGEIQIPLTETEKVSFEHNCKLNQFPFKQSGLVKFFEIVDYYKLVNGQITPNQLPQSSPEDTYFDSVKSGYVVDNFLLNHGLDFRAVVIKCPIDETTKASDVNKYFNFIVQKLTMQASKKYPILN